MVDPIGALSLGIQVCSGLLQYYKSWKDAGGEVKELYDSIARITWMFLAIRERLENAQSTGNDSERISACINSCTAAINKLEKKLEKFRELASGETKKKWKQALNRLQYPLEKKTLLKLKANTFEICTHLMEAMSIMRMDISIHVNRKVDSVERLIAEDVIPGIQEICLKGTDRATQEERNAIISWLSSLSPSTFTERQNASLGRRKKGTGTWILRKEAMKQWIAGTTPVVWCPGGPGCGNSVVMSTIVEHLEQVQGDSNIAVAYTYCVYNQEHQTIANFLASLLAQLAKQSSMIDTRLKTLWETYGQKSTKPSPEKYVRLLQLLSSQFSRVFILVDALDEFPERERRQFVAYLNMLSPDIQVLVTSRELLSIKSMFKDATRVEIRAHDEDIKIAISWRISEEAFLRDVVDQDPNLHDTIIDTIIRKANGMFLLAEFFITALSQEDNRRDLYEKLEHLPTDIGETYDQSLTRIARQRPNQATRAEQVLLWLTHACRPLLVRELQQALAIRPKDTEFNSSGEPSIEALVSCCMGLVVIDKPQDDGRPGQRYIKESGDVIRFVHYTAQEFFEQRRSQKYPHGHQVIAESCLSILTLSNFDIDACRDAAHGGKVRIPQDLLNRLQDKIPIVRYAAQHWGNHARLAFEQGPASTLSTNIQNFLGKQGHFIFSTWLTNPGGKLGFFYRGPYNPRLSPLHVLAAFGIVTMIEGTLKTPKVVQADVRDLYGRTPLHMACSNGHASVMNKLLEHGADKNALDQYERSPLQMAVENNYEAVVLSLLEIGVAISADNGLPFAVKNDHIMVTQILLGNMIDKSAFGSAMWDAAYFGRHSIVRMIVNASQGCERYHDWISRALVSASMSRDGSSGADKIALMDFLLSEGADPNYEVYDRYERPYTPLSIATSIEAIELLVRRGALANFQDSKGDTPLHSDSNTHEKAKFLISHGADINCRDFAGQTPLHTASRQAKEVLLDNHANVNVQDNDGSTPLMSAIKKWHYNSGHDDASEIMRMLQAGPDLNLQDRKGLTALHYAVFAGAVSICETLLQHIGGESNKTGIMQMARLYQSWRKIGEIKMYRLW